LFILNPDIKHNAANSLVCKNSASVLGNESPRHPIEGNDLEPGGNSETIEEQSCEGPQGIMQSIPLPQGRGNYICVNF